MARHGPRAKQQPDTYLITSKVTACEPEKTKSPASSIISSNVEAVVAFTPPVERPLFKVAIIEGGRSDISLAPTIAPADSLEKTA